MYMDLPRDPDADQSISALWNGEDDIDWSDSCDSFFFEPDPLILSNILEDTVTSQEEENSNYDDTSQSSRNKPADQQSHSLKNKSNSQPCGAWLDSNQGKKSNLSGNRHRRPKNKLFLSDPVQEFKNSFYSGFVSRKKFKKEFVKDIHNKILVDKIKGFEKMKRNEIRMIDNYFINYAPFQEEILRVLKDNHDFISKNILHF